MLVHGARAQSSVIAADTIASSMSGNFAVGNSSLLVLAIGIQIVNKRAGKLTRRR